MEEFFVLKYRFFVKKRGVIYVYIGFQTVETGKRQTKYKKGHQKFLALKWRKFFPKKLIRKVGRRNFVSVPPSGGST